MRKIIVNFSVVCISMFITIILIFTLNFLYRIDTLEQVSNQLIPKGALAFRTSANDVDFEEVYALLPDNTILINKYSWDSDIRSVVFKGSIYEFPLISGRNFTVEDINTGKRVAIAGRNILTQNRTFLYENRTYDIVGEIGCGFESEIDDICIFLMNDELINMETDFYIYGNDSQAIIEYLGNESLWEDVLILDNEALGITEAVNLKDRLGILPLLVFLVCILLNQLFWQKWVHDKENEIVIKNELGFDERETFLKFFLRAVLLIGIGVAAAIIVNCNIRSKILFQSLAITMVGLVFQPAIILLRRYGRGRNAN